MKINSKQYLLLDPPPPFLCLTFSYLRFYLSYLATDCPLLTPLVSPFSFPDTPFSFPLFPLLPFSYSVAALCSQTKSYDVPHYRQSKLTPTVRSCQGAGVKGAMVEPLSTSTLYSFPHTLSSFFVPPLSTQDGFPCPIFLFYIFVCYLLFFFLILCFALSYFLFFIWFFDYFWCNFICFSTNPLLEHSFPTY